jgi:hypothetical protein
MGEAYDVPAHAAIPASRDTDLPEPTACLAFLAAGDTLVVPRLDHLSRSLADLISRSPASPFAAA